MKINDLHNENIKSLKKESKKYGKILENRAMPHVHGLV